MPETLFERMSRVQAPSIPTPALTPEQIKLADELDADLRAYGLCAWKRDASGRAVRINPKDFYKEPDQ